MESASIRRMVAFVVGILAMALNKKLGLQLDDAAQVGIVTLIATYIGQSAYTQAQSKKADAVVAAAAVEKTTIVSDQSAVDAIKKAGL